MREQKTIEVEKRSRASRARKRARQAGLVPQKAKSTHVHADMKSTKISL